MEIKEMFETIREKRVNLGEVKDSIINSEKSAENKIVEAVFYLPSQSYGMVVKEIVFNSLKAIESSKACGYSEEYGDFNVKFCVSDGTNVVAKQASVYDEVDNYIIVSLNYISEDVSFFCVPKNVLLSHCGNRPDHGNMDKGYTEEYSARFVEDDLERYKIEFR